MKTKSDIGWLDYNYRPVSSIKDIPDGAYGFIYLITFEDGKSYIGKKNLYSTRTMAPLKDGTFRKGTISREYRNTGKGFRKAVDIVRKESDWQTYKGSSELCKDRIPKSKIILEYAYSALELTYAEAKTLFTYNVLGDPDYLNDNILGSFYRSALDAYFRRQESEKDSHSSSSNKS